MNTAVYRSILDAAPGCCTENRSLAPFLSYKVGGAADVYAEPNRIEELEAVLGAAHRGGVGVFILGGGTNLIVRDGGIRGVVVRLGRAFRTVRADGARVLAGASATMMQAALGAERAGLTGLEFGYDIPGTVGGAVQMNAGAHGSEIRHILEEVRGCTRSGEPAVVKASAIEFGYRAARYPVDLIAAEIVFALAEGNPEEVAARRKEYHAYRLRTQPKGRSVGSVFKNPPGDHAGRLVEAAGCKGLRVGGAVVSDKHANFILGDGGATAADIESLIRLIQKRVESRFGVRLETEVRIVGDPATLEP